MKNLALQDNPALLQLQQQMQSSNPVKSPKFASNNPVKSPKPARPSSKPKAPVVKMRTRVPEGSDNALTMAKEQILATAKTWGKSGTEERIQGILVGVMQSHGIDAANRIIMETKLNKFGWQAQVA